MKLPRALGTLPPTPALLALLALAFVLPGLFGHDPWKSFDAIGIEIVHQMHLSGDWLVPRMAGEPWLEDSPFYHWVALGFAKLLAPLLPFHDAVRAASGLFVLAACALLYQAARVAQSEHAPAEAASAVVLLIGTLGLMVHAHEAIPELATLAACSAALAAQQRAAGRPLLMGALFGAALGIAFLSTGPVTPLALLAAALLSAAACGVWRTRSYALFLAISSGALVIVAASWPLALKLRSPALFDAWWSISLRGQGTFGANVGYFAEISSWFLWPLWPLALWTLSARRRELLAPHLFAPLAAFLLLLLGVCLTGPAQDVTALAVLPPLALFAARGIPMLRRGAAAALDWFGVMSFTFFGALVWLGYAAMLTGWPPTVARNFAKLSPGFALHFSGLALGVAVALTALWLMLVVRLPPGPSRGATRWAAGVMLLWGTTATLWMPWVDSLKSYRPVALELRAMLPPQHACLAGRNIGVPQKAALSYHAGLRPRAEGRQRCAYLLVQGSARHERDAPGPGWTKLADIGRPGDKNERFRLYRLGR